MRINISSLASLLLASLLKLTIATPIDTHLNQVHPLEALNPWRTHPINVTVQQGSSLHLECFSTLELQTLPTVKIRWVRGKRKKFFYFVHARTVSRSSEPLLSPIQQTLHIKSVSLSDAGWWACMGNVYDITDEPRNKNPRSHFFIKWFHVRVSRSNQNNVNTINGNYYTKYGFKNATAEKFGGFKYLFSIGSFVLNFSIVAFCLAICGCLCCGGCLCL